MALGIDVTIRNARLDEITTALDAGAGAAKIKMYDGTRPATGAAITTQVLLATPLMSATSFPAASSGSMTANAVTTVQAVAASTLTWFRMTDSDDNFVCDGDIATSGSDLNVNTTTTSIGVDVDVTSIVLTAGNA